MAGRTIILVSHHVRLCSAGASYIVALENGRVDYSGDVSGFEKSGVMAGLVQSNARGKVVAESVEGDTDAHIIEEIAAEVDGNLFSSQGLPAESARTAKDTPDSATLAASTDGEGEGPATKEKKVARKLIDEEKRAVGRIAMPVWKTYFKANGSMLFWSGFMLCFIIAAVAPTLENAWLA